MLTSWAQQVRVMTLWNEVVDYRLFRVVQLFLDLSSSSTHPYSWSEWRERKKMCQTFIRGSYGHFFWYTDRDLPDSVSIFNKIRPVWEWVSSLILNLWVLLLELSTPVDPLGRWTHNFVSCCLLWSNKAKAKQKTYKSVGVMKDYKLKLRERQSSHTLLFIMNR